MTRIAYNDIRAWEPGNYTVHSPDGDSERVTTEYDALTQEWIVYDEAGIACPWGIEELSPFEWWTPGWD
jgi:hypothetical protein